MNLPEIPSKSARKMLLDAPFYVNPSSRERSISICAIKPIYFKYGGGVMQYIEILFLKLIIFSCDHAPGLPSRRL